jgi:hypothetical protein
MKEKMRTYPSKQKARLNQVPSLAAASLQFVITPRFNPLP